MKQIPITQELKHYSQMFYCHYIRIDNKPIAVVVIAKDFEDKWVRGTAVCGSEEDKFNAEQGYVLATRRALRSMKKGESKQFASNNPDANLSEFINLCGKISLEPYKYQYDCSLTKKEQKILNEVGFHNGLAGSISDSTSVATA